MGASNNEFTGGRNGMVEAFHVTLQSNRASIEKHGLLAQGLTTDPDSGKPNFGVFGSTNAKGAEYHATSGWGTSYPDDFYSNNKKYGPTFEEAAKNAPVEGGDIWAFSVPKEDAQKDTWTKNARGAVKVSYDIPASQVRRVGHVTSDNEVHWHPEEHCGR
jgi:hypothetical protein